MYLCWKKGKVTHRMLAVTHTLLKYINALYHYYIMI